MTSRSNLSLRHWVALVVGALPFLGLFIIAGDYGAAVDYVIFLAAIVGVAQVLGWYRRRRLF